MSHYVSNQYEVFMVFLFGVNLRQETDRQTDSQGATLYSADTSEFWPLDGAATMCAHCWRAFECLVTGW